MDEAWVQTYFCHQKINYIIMNNRIAILLAAMLGAAGSVAAAGEGKVLSPQSGQFFKTKMSSEIKVADCRNDSALCKMVATAMQGVVNQDSAQVYLFLGDHHKTQLDDTGRKYEVMPVEGKSKGASGFMSIVDNFGDRFRHIYIWDPGEEWSWNMALMLSSRNKGMPLTAELAEEVMSTTGWKGSVTDLRHRFQGKLDFYDWAIENILPQCHENVIFSVGLRDDWRGAPWTLYDYVTASGGFAFWLDDRDKTEQDEIRKICSAGGYKPGAIVMGYAKSGDDLLATVNNYGIGYVVSDYYANGSFWSAYPNKAFTQRPGNAVEAAPGNIYVSIVLSDGDNLQFGQNALYNLWSRDENRGSVPVGTTMAAGLQEINPFLLEWYYSRMTPNDELVAGPSGFQFIYGRDYDTDSYETWLKLNREWLESAGFHTGCLWHTTYGTDTFRRYIETSGLKAIFDGDDATGVQYVDGVVVMNQGEHLVKEGEMYNALIKLTPDPGAPLFVNLYPIAAEYCRGDGMSILKREIERLEAERPGVYHYLLPKDLAATASKYFEKTSRNDITLNED